MKRNYNEVYFQVHSQLLLPGPATIQRDVNGFEVCGPITSTITIIDNPTSLGAANALQSMILNNVLDSALHMVPDSYGNIDFMVPCSFVIESVTYSPVVDVFYPTECLPMFDIYPAPYADITPNVFLTETLPPKVFYTETITSFAPSAITPIPSSSDIIGLSDFYAPNLQTLPVSCINSLDVIPLNSIPSNSIGLIDLILPPPMFGGYSDIYFSGIPSYFDSF